MIGSIGWRRLYKLLNILVIIGALAGRTSLKAAQQTTAGISGIWLIGALLSIVQAIMSVSGMALQRASNLENDALPEDKRRPKRRRSKAVWGFLLYLLSQPLLAVALTLCPLAMIAPLSCGMSIVCSSFSARAIGEKYSRADITASVLAFVGAVGCVWFGPHIEDLKTSLESALAVLNWWRHPRLLFFFPTMFAMLIGCIASIKYGSERVAAIAQPVAAAICGSFSETSAKVLGMFISQGWTYISDNPGRFVGVACMSGGFGIMSMVVVTRAAAGLDNRFFLPAYVCMAAMFMQIFGILEFGEMDHFQPSQVVLFAGSTLLCICSVVLGSAHFNKSSTGKDGDPEADASPKRKSREEMGMVSGNYNSSELDHVPLLGPDGKLVLLKGNHYQTILSPDDL